MYRLIRQQISDINPDVYMEENNKSKIKELKEKLLKMIDSALSAESPCAPDLLKLAQQAIENSTDFYLKN